MARTPNYRFERQEREKAKAARKEAKAKERLLNPDAVDSDDEDGAEPGASTEGDA